MEASQASEAGSIPVARSTSRLAERRAVLLCHLPARAAIPAKYRLHLRICGGADHRQEQHTCAEAPCQSPSAQSVVHLAHNTPFSAFFAEVVCSLSTVSGAPTAKRGGITTIDPRHAGDTPTETFYGSNSPHRRGRRWAAWTPRWCSGPYRAGTGRRPEGRGPARAHTATATINTTGN